MKTGFRGTFVISWSQTEIDGLDSPPLQALNEGAAWSWRGDAVRVDGPSDILRLDDADGAEELRMRAARMVHRLVGAALDRDTPKNRASAIPDIPLMDNSFIVTDGGRSYNVTVIEIGGGKQPLLMFYNDLPPRDSDLWVVHHSLDAAAGRPDPATGGVICFTPGTLIRTADGSRPMERLREGDLVQTKDNGLQTIRWIGSRRMSGARLHAMPHLRPVRIRAHRFEADLPDADLVVSPEHRLMVKGPVAQALFNSHEVMVAAKDLIDGRNVIFDRHLREVTYIHMLLDRHEVVWGNGIETESFHPASASLSALDEMDRARLLTDYPDLAHDPHTYGPLVRRNLTSSEAAILAHAA
ncbi:MAG: Hint domain-containing protein [Sulfitobacter sp.]|nr:Hint domain-containing protein [Sulfitobacter sp.]